DNGRPAMFPATCDKCHERCEVPFKPNGSKPVYCSNCFVKDDGHESKRFGGPHSFGSRSEGPRSEVNSDVQLRAINKKLDIIIEALTSQGLMDEEGEV
ncbi:MAG: hypothetical protein PHC70_04105, partial [Patescibacteria group bacterium]|nr:hypothetical protein [Patescibacteria group bacterium]